MRGRYLVNTSYNHIFKKTSDEDIEGEDKKMDNKETMKMCL